MRTNYIDLRRLNLCNDFFYLVIKDCCLTVNFSPECSYIGLGFVNEHIIHDVFSIARSKNDDSTT